MRWIAAVCVLLLVSCGTAESAGLPEYSLPPEEKRLSIYTSHKREVWWPIVKEFEDRTGIWVEVTEGGTNELLERIYEEREHPEADLMFGGGVESLQYYSGVFTPYRAEGSDRLDRQFEAEGDFWTPFSALPLVLIYNPKLVEAEELEGWSDLMAPMFRGEIAFADPRRSGSSLTALLTMIRARGTGERVLEEFALQLKGKQLEDSGEVPDAVADGTALAGVTLEETALKRIAAGQNLTIVYPVEGTSAVPDGSALVAGAAHSENAKQFLDFTLTEDVQNLIVERFCRRSVLKDAAASEDLPPLKDIRLISYNVREASGTRNEVLMKWTAWLNREGTE
ncbi:MAG: extracellular solute-binding protein [Stomatobaculum sp.]|nr:extracellular solute-binding protein [Stomatobaculum sp.]